MAFSKALVQPFRRNELSIGAGWRGYFAPFNAPFWANQVNSAVGPTIIDLQSQGPFNTNSMPAGWFDLGWIRETKITPASKIGQIRSGYRGAVRAQVRGEVGEQIEFKFREFTRMAFRISTGSETFNLLKTSSTSTVGPLSMSGVAAVTVGASGYQANGAGALAGSPVVFLPAGSGSLFTAGQMVVVDYDYDKATVGFVGSVGIPIFVNNAPQDVDFIRKTSDYIQTIKQVVTNVGGVAGNQDALVLNGVFAGGGASPSANPGPTSPTNNNAPNGGAGTLPKVQVMNGWCAREGGTFILDYSAIFIMDTIDGDQFVLYYPHLSIQQFKDIPAWAIDNAGTTDETGYELDASFECLAFDDPLDGETVVGYRAWYPAVGSGVPI